MIAFGGAGPLHAIAVAREIFIPRVIIPKLPGTFSALGMLMANWRQDFVRTLVGGLEKIDAKLVQKVFAELTEDAHAQLARDGVSKEGAEFKYYADLRYVGQEHALQIPLRDASMLSGDTAEVREAFHVEHDQRYGQAAKEEKLEVVNLRLVLTAARADTIAEEWMTQDWTPTDNAAETSRDVIFTDSDKPLKTRILWRPSLPAGFSFTGPAVIEEPNSTILIHPGDKVTVTKTGHLIVDIHFPESAS
jgi:N-methylhydantoinase A